MRIFLGICLAILALSAPSAFAQVGDLQSIVTPQMGIDLMPLSPQPGQEVTATINDYGGGMFGSSITWVLNGEVIPAATNRRSAQVVVGELGETTQIQAILTRSNGTQEVLSTIVRPIYIDIILEPQTRVPDFYLGRSLPSVGSLVNATAVVYDGSFRNDLVYTWRVNREVVEAGPIRGRNKVTFETPIGDEAILSLQVSEPNGQVLGNRSILVPLARPEIFFYEVNPLLGLSEQPLADGHSILGGSLTLRAEPFHLDSRVYNNPDVSEWEINRQSTSNGSSNPYEVTLQRTGATGRAELNFHVRSTQQVLQGAEDSIRINF